MDSEIVIFGAVGMIGGALALLLAHFYTLPNIENSSRQPAFLEFTQRERMPVEPAQR